MTKAYVYFFRNEDNGLTKIGVAREPLVRMKAVQVTEETRNLKLLGQSRALPRKTAFTLERRLHDRFAKHRKHGEWFKLPRDTARWPSLVKVTTVEEFKALSSVLPQYISSDIARKSPFTLGYAKWRTIEEYQERRDELLAIGCHRIYFDPLNTRKGFRIFGRDKRPGDVLVFAGRRIRWVEVLEGGSFEQIEPINFAEVVA